MGFLKSVHRYIPGFRQLSSNSMVIAATYYGVSAFVTVRFWHWGLALLALPFLVFNLLEMKTHRRGKLPLILAAAAGLVVLLGSAAGLASGGLHAAGAAPAPIVITAAPRPSAAPSFSPAPAMAAAPGASAEQAQFAFAAAKGGEVYHRLECSSAKRIKSENLVGFRTREEAEASGLRPCRQCKP